MKPQTSGKFGAFGVLTVAAAVVVLAACVHPRPAVADQPQMHEALRALRDAERHLGQATHDKGGHRVKALEHVRAAIHQVEAGIRFDRRN